MSGLEYFAIVYIIIWLLFFGYAFRILRIQKKQEAEIKELEEKIKRI